MEDETDLDSSERDVFKPDRSLSRTPIKEGTKDVFQAMMGNSKKDTPKIQRSVSSSDLPPKEGEKVTTGKPNLNKKCPPAESPLKLFQKQLLALERQILEQTTIKREIKAGIREVTRQFNVLLEENLQNNSINKIISTAGMEVANFRREIIDACGDMRKIEQVIEKKWPAGAFTNTKISAKDFSKDEAVISSIIVYVDDFQNDPNYIQLAQRSPGLKQVTGKNLQDLGSIQIEKEESTVIPGIASLSKLKIIQIIQPALISEAGNLKIADVMNWADVLKNKAAQAKRNVVVVSIPDDADHEKTRKIMEASLINSELTVIFKPNRKERQPTVRRNETIIVSGNDNKSFADMLKDVKANIDPKTLGVEIKRVGATAAGDLRLIFQERAKGGCKNLVSGIKERAATVKKVQLFENIKGIVLMDIEEDIEAEEVKMELHKQLGVKVDDIKMNEFRLSKRGSKMVTVFLPTEFAEKAIQKRKIKIGWTMCTAKERIDPKLCETCQCYGHPKADCKEKRQQLRRCLKCGIFGHASRDCEGKESCFSCNIEGHRANSMTCPIYRDLVHKMKLNKNKNA